MSDQYVKTAARLPELLRAVEDYVERKRDGASVSLSELTLADPRRLASKDEVLAIAAALFDIGVLSERSSGFVVDTTQLSRTRLYRSGVADAVSWLGNRPQPASTLCAAVPPEFETTLRTRIYEVAVDLRAAVLDVIATAETNLVLASPFWDSETLRELTPLLERRMDFGVKITALGRFRRHEVISLSPYLRNLIRHSNFTAVSWFNSSGSAVSTFHFKAVIADEGRKAYLGSANLTTSGLRSRMELGAIHSGEIARCLAVLVNTVISVSRSVEYAD